MNEMTRKICEKLGKAITGRETPFECGVILCGLHYFSPDFRTSPALADLLDNKLAQSGWEITLIHGGNFPDMFWAEGRFIGGNKMIRTDGQLSRPAALTELFTKVYNIPWEPLKEGD